MRRAFLTALGALALAGCSASLPDAPGLQPRPAEHQPILPPDAVAEPQIAADPALVAQLARLVADARAGHAAFETERAGLSGALARGRGAGEGTDAWIAGQQALSALEAAKAPVQAAASAIDGLRADPGHAGSGDREAIDAAAGEVATMADAEAQALGGL